MTHHMELLATNQPWKPPLLMAVPVILAETLAITELAMRFSRGTTGGMLDPTLVGGGDAMAAAQDMHSPTH
jgi:hypothetical protein